ncbi:MAG: diaminopimelate epimerase [Ignavibacteria bacterium]|nr:diaminopimelate epimerase [Ignavibacteria bacterium]MBT8391044.1 diaminopimelate epimerase [Ignavibacteria bacterium]NNJ54192.1 diaminopimelate epimerase [Ignavibacteriaceae bacterium]NNL20699.1 diaminopimelate epimerase [Ignavibacteriaceae bacterium]
MKKISFTKMSGTGNDFVFIDETINPGLKIERDLVSKLCNRKNGIGADGVVTLIDSVKYDFIMNYYNADGSTGSLCANGARCAILFASKSGRLKNSTAKFLSNDEEFSGEILTDGNVKFNLNPPKKIKYNFKVKAADQLIKANFVDTGSPHVVIKIDEPENNFNFFNSLDNLPVDSIGREIRYLPEFAPSGTNVNFVKIIDGAIKIRSYERGVEAETLSCGTGSVAAAIITYVTDGLRPPIKIITKENENLFVNFDIENQKVKNVSLTGAAKIVFSGEIDLFN